MLPRAGWGLRALRGACSGPGPAAAPGGAASPRAAARRRALCSLQRLQEPVPGAGGPGAPGGERPLQAGELVLAELRRRRHGEFRRMCQLTALGRLNSCWGVVEHGRILGKLPGQMVATSQGVPLLVRRPALDEFVLLMKRGPTISYPKDINAMLLMMDIHPGDTVLESGSGSGAMSLFLSRAVGPQGRVISYEIRKDHHAVAKKNYRLWRDAWVIGHVEEWPDNVDFIKQDILTAAEDMKSITFDAVALDMLCPQAALPIVYPNLKQGGVCAVYLANITQVIELLEGIRRSKLPLLCERIVELTQREWLIQPARQDSRLAPRVEAQQNIDEEPQQDEEYLVQEQAVFGGSEESLSEHVAALGSVPYIARPYPWQVGHTAFLIKLRKFNPVHPDTVPDDSW
ncbi:tRNA (adenine(58)-N(1))-methyltransferase, mitochondrial isoform X2 [Alligator mississippiensis]|uniref:tRNA (adenine(58)-N(1))-methyltransferase, mitochondrial isoform X2 n=1 Tax=Alligator mississippiensis TaxID=8496 RepID=UPI002877B67B|nr:tRNA (adenine(58)-N(1))-methyltransferase, mitochondrial isoform X2 [Alligator mississippiensis]